MQKWEGFPFQRTVGRRKKVKDLASSHRQCYRCWNEGRITAAAGKPEKPCRMDSLWRVPKESNKQKSACSEKTGDLMVHEVHIKGVIEGKRVDECLGNFTSNAGQQNLGNSLLLLLLLYLNICMTGRLKDDCSWRLKVPKRQEVFEYCSPNWETTLTGKERSGITGTRKGASPGKAKR